MLLNPCSANMIADKLCLKSEQNPAQILLDCCCVDLPLDICLSVDQDFEEACFLLKKCGAVHVSQQEVVVSDAGLEVLSFLRALLQPFIDSYQVL